MSNRADEPSGRNPSWDEAEELFKRIADDGDIDWQDHCLEELVNDNLTTLDFMNALRGGRIDRVEKRFGKIRYCVANRQMTAVVSITSETELCAITAWKNDK